MNAIVEHVTEAVGANPSMHGFWGENVTYNSYCQGYAIPFALAGTAQNGAKVLYTQLKGR